MSSEETHIIPPCKVVCFPDLSTEIHFKYVYEFKRIYLGKNFQSPAFSPSTNQDLKWHIVMRTDAKYQGYEVSVKPLEGDLSDAHFSCNLEMAENSGEHYEVEYPPRRARRERRTNGVFLTEDWPRPVKDDWKVRNPRRPFDVEVTCHAYLKLAASRSTVRCKKCPYCVQMKAMRDKLTFSDITINVSGRDFSAHKSVLKLRSPVFAAMFEHDMMEKTLGRIDINDISAEAFDAMLKYMYTGTPPSVDEIADELLMVSNKYELPKLKEIAERSLRLQTNNENAANTFIIADFHNASELRAYTKKFITINAPEIMSTKGFKTLHKNSKLLVEILQAVIAAHEPSDD